MTALKINGFEVTLSNPTTKQALMIMDLHRKLAPKADISDPKAALSALRVEDAQALIDLMADVTSIPVDKLLSWPLDVTMQAAIDVATVWLPLLAEYLNGTITPMLESIAKP
jgi:hypothetical protein